MVAAAARDLGRRQFMLWIYFLILVIVALSFFLQSEEESN